MQQLALEGWHSNQLTRGLGSWYLDSCLSIRPARVGFVSNSSARSPYQGGGPTSVGLHTPEPWVCAGLFSSRIGGSTWDGCCHPCFDPRPSPARTGLLPGGFIQMPWLLVHAPVVHVTGFLVGVWATWPLVGVQSGWTAGIELLRHSVHPVGWHW